MKIEMPREIQLMTKLNWIEYSWKLMKYSWPRLKATSDSFKMKVSMVLTELEWKFGFLKR